MENLAIRNLLQHAGIIYNKHREFQEITGENFNIFDILNVRSNELSHSLFLTYLLDAQGKHGQKDLFLKLFINQIINQFESKKNNVLERFKTEISFTKSEKYLGNKSEDVSNGGRIDILISDGTNNLIIENKIYAVDQEKQMYRYYNFDKDAPLIYLSLDENGPSEDSIKHKNHSLKINQDYISISYKHELKSWIENCIKVVYDKPFIRETLSQYLNLINKLTNQSNNNKMKEEINSIIETNYDSFIKIINQQNSFNDYIVKKLSSDLLKKINEFGFELNYNNLNKKDKYSGISLKNDVLENNNVSFKIEYFPDKFYFGFYWLDKKNSREIKTKLIAEFNNQFGQSRGTDSFPCLIDFKQIYSWEEFVKGVINGDFLKEFSEILSKLKDISNNLYSNHI